MPLVSSGAISIGGSTASRSINLELGRAASATSSLGETALRNLAGVASGAISLSNFYGKSNLAASLPQYNPGGVDIDLARYYYGNFYGEAYVDIILYTDGTGAYRVGDSGIPTTNVATFTWKTGGGAVGDYFAYMYASTADPFDSGTSAVDTALALSTQRRWMLLVSNSVQDSYVSAFASSTLQIRNSAGTALASRTLNFSAGVQLGIGI